MSEPIIPNSYPPPASVGEIPSGAAPSPSSVDPIGGNSNSSATPAPIVSVPPTPVAATPLPSAEQAQLAAVQLASNQHAALLPLKADLESGKLKIDQLPTIELLEFRGVVANETAMLSLTDPAFGDVVGRADDSNNLYILVGVDGTVAGNWLATSVTVPAVDTSRLLDAVPPNHIIPSTASIGYRQGSHLTLSGGNNGIARIWMTERDQGTSPELLNSRHAQGYVMEMKGNSLYNVDEWRLIRLRNGVESVTMHHRIDGTTNGFLFFDEVRFHNRLHYKEVDGWQTNWQWIGQNKRGRVLIDEDNRKDQSHAHGVELAYDGTTNKAHLGTVKDGESQKSIQLDKDNGHITILNSIDFNNQPVTGLGLTPEYDNAAFCVTTDWHMYYPNAGGNQRARDAWQEIGNYRPALGIHVGDLLEPVATSSAVDYALLRDGEKTSGCAWLHAIGNHEAGLNPSSWGATEISRSQAFYNGLRDAYTRDTYELNTTDDAQDNGYYAMYHERSGLTHIVLNACQTDTGSGWAWTTAQRDWLQGVLDNLTVSDRVVIYSHVPPQQQLDTYNGWTTAANNELHTMLAGFVGKIAGVFCGHTHTSALNTVDGIHYITLRASEINGTASKSAAYGGAGTANLSFAMVKWDEVNSQTIITGINGEISRTLNV